MNSILHPARQVSFATRPTVARLATLVIVTALMLVMAVATGCIPRVHGEPAGASTGEDFAIAVDAMTPAVVTNSSDLTVTGSVTSGAEERRDVTITVRMRSDSAVTIPEVEQYLDGSTFPGRWIAQTTIAHIPAHRSQPFSITIPSDSLPFESTWEWGPRGVSVTASTEDDSRETRTLALWDSGYPVERTRLAVLTPVTLTPRSLADTVLWPALSDAEVMRVRALAKNPAVSIATTPSLLSSSNGSTALANAAHPVVALPPDDPDISAIAHLDDPSIATRWLSDAAEAHPINEKALTAKGIRVTRGIVVSAASRIDLDTVKTWSGQTIIAPDTGIDIAEPLTYQPSTWMRVDPETGESVTDDTAGVNVILAHSTLSTLLATPTSSTANEFTLMQMLRATTAIITRELPNYPRTLVALAPRGVPSQQLAARIEALTSPAWVEGVSVADVAAAGTEGGVGSSDDERPDGARVERTPILSAGDIAALVDTSESGSDPTGTDAGEISPAEFARLARAVTSTHAVTSAMEYGDSTQLALEKRAIRALSVASRPPTSLTPVSGSILTVATSTRRLLTEAVESAAAHLSEGVVVAPSATINLLDSHAKMPVRVSNHLNQSITVVVRLEASDPRLQIEEVPTRTIGAHDTTVVEVPVNAVGSGDVTIRAIVTAPDGTVIDDATELTVRVRAGWESTGMLITAIALGVLVVIGVIRTVRRGRRMDQ